MAKYLTLFNTHSRYETYNTSDSFLTPNVTYCENEVHIHYVPRYDYSQDYLTFKARETGTFSFTKSIYYSIDSGETWTSLSANTQSPTIEAGDKIMWRYANNGANGSSSYGVGTFSSTGEFDIQGNIMSLRVNTNDFSNVTLTTYNFYKLFQNSKVVNAKYLVLPATMLADHCYYYMFDGCTSLTTAPELPATTLANYCYDHMFRGCSSLTTAPELPATTLAERCYYYMFRNCTSLTTTPELPATTLSKDCYSDMFYGCTSLTVAPELPATTLAQYCYQDMLRSCTSLTIAPELPATTLANGCYANMFTGCSNLTVAPELPATTLADYCYMSMFDSCTSLTTTPELPATTLASSCYFFMFGNCTSLTTALELPATTLTTSCYQYMFQGCTSLNYIKCLATDISANDCLNKWVDEVASTGTFIKDVNMNDWTTGDSGIPTGWTVENVETSETRLIAKYNIIDTSSATSILNAGYSSNISAIEIDGVTLDNVVNSYTFSTTGEHIIKYTLIDNTSIGENTFEGCRRITSVDIPNSVTTIDLSVFYNCANLANVIIPNSVTSINGLAFYNCTSLTSVIIPNSVTNIVDLAFHGCSGLTSITIPNSVTSIGIQAFENCSGLESVTIGNSVTSIGEEAFIGCSELRILIVQATTPPTLDSGVLAGTNANLVIKVPSASINAYKTASNWSDYASNIQAI